PPIDGALYPGGPVRPELGRGLPRGVRGSGWPFASMRCFIRPSQGRRTMSALKIRKAAGALGAEISGVDLSAELPDAVIAQIRAAFVEHQVIFFRDQHLSPEQQVAFGRRFGPLNIHPYVAGMAGHPEVMEIIKEPEDKVNFGGGWHSDMSFLPEPSIGSILYAVELPEWGGDTLFASQAAAYEALSPGLKATLETLNAVHSAGREYSSAGHSAQKRQSMKVVEAEGAVGEFV